YPRCRVPLSPRPGRRPYLLAAMGVLVGWKRTQSLTRLRMSLSRIKNVMLVAPRSTGGNFEYVAIFRQGTLFLSGALRDWQGPFLYDRQIWFEDRSGKIDPDKDLEGVDLLLVTALSNEAPRAYEIARDAKQYHPNIKTLGGGPHMGPLPEEAIREGNFDVIVQREGEDVIGPLCDLLLSKE